MLNVEITSVRILLKYSLIDEPNSVRHAFVLAKHINIF